MPKTLLQSVVGQLQKERVRLEDELHRVTAAITAFGKVYLAGSKSKPAATRKSRTMSVAARKKIAVAQKARWAKIKAEKLKAEKTKPNKTNAAKRRSNRIA
jgi:hypothetical protein